MLPRAQSNFEAAVIRDGLVISITCSSGHDIDVPSEHLVKVATLAMGLSAISNSGGKVAVRQSLSHH